MTDKCTRCGCSHWWHRPMGKPMLLFFVGLAMVITPFVISLFVSDLNSVQTTAGTFVSMVGALIMCAGLVAEWVCWAENEDS